MSLASTNGADAFNRGEAVGYLKGTATTVGLDAFNRGEADPFIAGHDISIAGVLATASAAASVPIPTVVILPSALAATGAGVAPLPILTMLPGAMTATAAAPVPIPTVVILPGAIAATSASLAPLPILTLLPAASTATAAELAPVQTVVILPAALAATSAAAVPVPTLTLLPGAMTAAATGLNPFTVLVGPTLIDPPVATATAAAIAPTLIQGITAFADAFTGTKAAALAGDWADTYEDGSTPLTFNGAQAVFTLPASTSGAHYSGLYSTVGWNAVGSAAAIEIAAVPTANASSESYFSLWGDSGANSVSIHLINTTISFKKNVGGSASNLATATYNAVSMRWWRLREASGTTYWETSPDGSVWTTRASALNPVNLSESWVEIGAGTFGSIVSPGTFTVEGFNVLTVAAVAMTATGASLVAAPTNVVTPAAMTATAAAAASLPVHVILPLALAATGVFAAPTPIVQITAALGTATGAAPPPAGVGSLVVINAPSMAAQASEPLQAVVVTLFASFGLLNRADAFSNGEVVGFLAGNAATLGADSFSRSEPFRLLTLAPVATELPPVATATGAMIAPAVSGAPAVQLPPVVTAAAAMAVPSVIVDAAPAAPAAVATGLMLVPVVNFNAVIAAPLMTAHTGLPGTYDDGDVYDGGTYDSGPQPAIAIPPAAMVANANGFPIAFSSLIQPITLDAAAAMPVPAVNTIHPVTLATATAAMVAPVLIIGPVPPAMTAAAAMALVALIETETPLVIAATAAMAVPVIINNSAVITVPPVMTASALALATDPITSPNPMTATGAMLAPATTNDLTMFPAAMTAAALARLPGLLELTAPVSLTAAAAMLGANLEVARLVTNVAAATGAGLVPLPIVSGSAAVAAAGGAMVVPGVSVSGSLPAGAVATAAAAMLAPAIIATTLVAPPLATASAGATLPALVESTRILPAAMTAAGAELGSVPAHVMTPAGMSAHAAGLAPSLSRLAFPDLAAATAEMPTPRVIVPHLYPMACALVWEEAVGGSLGWLSREIDLNDGVALVGGSFGLEKP